jgi:hypothetical protein
MIDMEVIAAGNFSDPRQPAALQLPNNTQVRDTTCGTECLCCQDLHVGDDRHSSSSFPGLHNGCMQSAIVFLQLALLQSL